MEDYNLENNINKKYNTIEKKNTILINTTSNFKYTKTNLNKLRLENLQNIAKEKNIDIFNLSNGRQISKTKKILILEILSV